MPDFLMSDEQQQLFLKLETAIRCSARTPGFLFPFFNQEHWNELRTAFAAAGQNFNKAERVRIGFLTLALLAHFGKYE